MHEMTDTRLGFRVPVPDGLFGCYLLCWRAGRDAAEKGKGWKVGLLLGGKALRIYRLGWLSHKTGLSLSFGDRTRKAIRLRLKGMFGKWRSAAGRKGAGPKVAQGQATRAKIIDALRANGAMRLKDVALAVALSPGSVHHQLGALKHEGVVLAGRAGRESRYELAKEVAA